MNVVARHKEPVGLQHCDFTAGGMNCFCKGLPALPLWFSQIGAVAVALLHQIRGGDFADGIIVVAHPVAPASRPLRAHQGYTGKLTQGLYYLARFAMAKK